jgi:hypothetical protein
MSVLLLHNGNCLIKPWASKVYKCESMPCLVDPWADAETFDEKYALATTKNICTDLTTADSFGAQDIFVAKQHFKTVKIITDYQHDQENLESVWHNGYTQQQWLRSVFFRLSFADDLVFHQPVRLCSDTTLPPIIFTPGRSGTHVLKGVTGISNYLHHDYDDLIFRPEFKQLADAEILISVLRKQFAKQVISDAISNRYGTLLTTKNNYDENVKLISQWKPFQVTAKDYEFSLEKICSYTDLLLGLFIFYNKQVQFSLLEELDYHYDKIPHVKNPYQPQDIISNYEELIEVCDQQYQSGYEQIINRIKSITGTQLYTYV